MKRSIHLARVAVIAALLVSSTTLALSSQPAAATELSLTLLSGAEFQFGGLFDFFYEGDDVEFDDTLEALGWDSLAVFDMNLYAEVDEFTAGDHLVMSLVMLEFASGCIVTMHGPLTIDHVGAIVYHAFFTDDELGGVLYDNCTLSEENLVEDSLDTSGLLVLFEIEHTPGSSVTVEELSTMTLDGDEIDFDLNLDEDCVDDVTSTAPAVVSPWTCAPWSGVQGSSTGMTVEADELVVDDGVEATLGDGSGAIDITIGSCVITIDGDRDFAYAGGTDSYVLSGDTIGAYSLSGCNGLETLLITTELGASPSSNPLTGELFIEVTS